MTETRRDRLYLPQLDILRFCAFMVVFVHHAVPQSSQVYRQWGFDESTARWILAALSAGGLGVDLFFALSSFLITLLLYREYEQRGRIDLKAFWMRRILRIWPLYYAYLAVALFVVPHFAPSQANPTEGILSLLFFYANYYTAANGYMTEAVSPLWSVSIEEQFYLLWPLLIGTLRPRMWGVLCGVFLAASTVTRFVLVSWGVEHPGIWCNTLARMDPLALGALLALWYRGVPEAQGLRWKHLLLMAICVAIPIAFLRHFGVRSFSERPALAFYPLVALCSTGLIALAVKAKVNTQGRMVRALCYLGRISYGLYVFHYFVLWSVEQNMAHLGTAPQSLAHYGVKCGIALTVTILVAAISFELFEKPILKLKARFARVH